MFRNASAIFDVFTEICLYEVCVISPVEIFQEVDIAACSNVKEIEIKKESDAVIPNSVKLSIKIDNFKQNICNIIRDAADKGAKSAKATIEF